MKQDDKMYKINLINTKFDKAIKGPFYDSWWDFTFNLCSRGHWNKYIKKCNEKYYAKKKEEWKKLRREESEKEAEMKRKEEIEKGLYSNL